MIPKRNQIAHPLRSIAIAAVALAAAGCSTLNLPAPLQTTVIVAPLKQSERDFLAQVAAKGMYEVEVSRLAARRATDPRVRSYADMVVAHHDQANAELIALMSAKGVAPPKTLAPKSARKLHRLAALPPSADFDRAYVRVVGVEDHSESIALFERIRADARDRDLKAWIDRTLPVLRRQLVVAHNLAGSIAA